MIAPHHPTAQNLERRFAPSSPDHLLGTDNFGRDILTRVIFGSRSALLVGIVAVTIAVVLGSAVGLVAGLAGRHVDNALMLFMDSLLSFPTILLAITVVSFLGYGLVQVMLAIGVIFSPVFARLVRAETLVIKTESYVEASRALGTPAVKTVFKHIIPNLAGKVVVQCSITFAMTVVIEASLSYLGLGTQPPDPSWGLMLKDARNYLAPGPLDGRLPRPRPGADRVVLQHPGGYAGRDHQPQTVMMTSVETRFRRCASSRARCGVRKVRLTRRDSRALNSGFYRSHRAGRPLAGSV